MTVDYEVDHTPADDNKAIFKAAYDLLPPDYQARLLAWFQEGRPLGAYDFIAGSRRCFLGACLPEGTPDRLRNLPIELDKIDMEHDMPLGRAALRFDSLILTQGPEAARALILEAINEPSL